MLKEDIKMVKTLYEYLNEATLAYLKFASSKFFKGDGIERAKVFLKLHAGKPYEDIYRFLLTADEPLSTSKHYRRYLTMAIIAYYYQCSTEVVGYAIKQCALDRQCIQNTGGQTCTMTDSDTLKKQVLEGWMNQVEEYRDDLSAQIEIECNMATLVDKLNCTYHELANVLANCISTPDLLPKEIKQKKRELLQRYLAGDENALDKISDGLDSQLKVDHLEMRSVRPF